VNPEFPNAFALGKGDHPPRTFARKPARRLSANQRAPNKDSSGIDLFAFSTQRDQYQMTGRSRDIRKNA